MSATRPAPAQHQFTQEMTQMSMDGIRINHAGLDQASADLAGGVREIDHRLSQLDHELAPLRSDWTGRAQGSYVQAKATWDAAITEMKQLLSETSTTVAQSNADYQAADRRGAAAFEM